MAKLSPIPETLENELDCSGICDDEQKPLSLTEQVLELKQALKQLVEIGSGQAASVEAQTTINRLEEERYLGYQRVQNSSNAFNYLAVNPLSPSIKLQILLSWFHTFLS